MTTVHLSFQQTSSLQEYKDRLTTCGIAYQEQGNTIGIASKDMAQARTVSGFGLTKLDDANYQVSKVLLG